MQSGEGQKKRVPLPGGIPVLDALASLTFLYFTAALLPVEKLPFSSGCLPFGVFPSLLPGRPSFLTDPPREPAPTGAMVEDLD